MPELSSYKETSFTSDRVMIYLRVKSRFSRILCKFVWWNENTIHLIERRKFCITDIAIEFKGWISAILFDLLFFLFYFLFEPTCEFYTRGKGLDIKLVIQQQTYKKLWYRPVLSDVPTDKTLQRAFLVHQTVGKRLWIKPAGLSIQI